MSIKFSVNEMRLIALFESTTGAVVKDCIIDDNNQGVTFVVKNGEMGLAIGKKGQAVSKVKKAIGKNVAVIELNDDPAVFIQNSLSPAKLQSVKITKNKSGDKIAIVTADNANKRLAIGKQGVNIERAKLLSHRHHDINNIYFK